MSSCRAPSFAAAPARTRCQVPTPGVSRPHTLLCFVQPSDGTGAAPEPRAPLEMQQVAEQMMADPAAAASLQRVSAAAQRVAELQAESQRLAEAIATAEASGTAAAAMRERESEAAAAALIADAEVQAAEKLLLAAQLQAQDAEEAKRKWSRDVNEDAERLESAKAGAVAGLGGALAALPFALSDTSAPAALLGLATAALASALLGVTYRYAVRGDVGNLQLKAGVLAAFGLTRGLGQATGALTAVSRVGSPADSGFLAGLDLSAAGLGSAGLAVGQSMLVAAFAATAMEVAFQSGLIKPFGEADS